MCLHIMPHHHSIACIPCAANRNESEFLIGMTGAANNSRGSQRQYATTRRRPRENCGGDSREEGWGWAVKDVSIVAREESSVYQPVISFFTSQLHHKKKN